MGFVIVRLRPGLAGTVMRTSVPDEPDLMVSAPPTLAARSPHRGQPDPAGGRLGDEPVAVVADLEGDPARGPGQADADRGRPGVPQRVVQRFLGDPVQCRLLAGAEGGQLGPR